ncbi:MAG: hypothetical protein M3164_00700 [Actinomycetota bacterium]|nr:hypothetical protein [Actinomycetota bacterium]
MDNTRVTIVLDVVHEPTLEFPKRAADYLNKTLGQINGVKKVNVVRGELGNAVWTPHGR